MLKNKRIVVTGAHGALGKSITAVALEQGADVVALDLHTDSDSSLEQYAVDLTDNAATKTCFEQIGSFNGLFNIAGGFTMGAPVWDEDDQQWEQMLNMNVATLRNAVKQVAPKFIAQKAGSIVNVGAFGALQGAAHMSAYCASKSIVMRLTESLSAELKPHGINVNAVLPTIIDTPANRQAMPDADTSTWVDPKDLANVICFLGSDQSRAIHGALIPTNG